MKKRKIALLSILFEIMLLISKIITSIFVDEKDIVSIILLLISMIGFILINLGIDYLIKIKHLEKISRNTMNKN